MLSYLKFRVLLPKIIKNEQQLLCTTDREHRNQTPVATMKVIVTM